MRFNVSIKNIINFIRYYWWLFILAAALAYGSSYPADAIVEGTIPHENKLTVRVWLGKGMFVPTAKIIKDNEAQAYAALPELVRFNYDYVYYEPLSQFVDPRFYSDAELDKVKEYVYLTPDLSTLISRDIPMPLDQLIEQGKLKVKPAQVVTDKDRKALAVRIKDASWVGAVGSGGGFVLVIPKGCQNVEAACRYINWAVEKYK